MRSARLRPALSPAAWTALFLSLVHAAPVHAGTARSVATAPAREFLAGDARGTALSADGRLTLGPPLSPRDWPEDAADAVVFAAASDKTGRVFVAAGGGLGRLFVSEPGKKTAL